MISILIPCYNYNAYDIVSRLEKECLTLGIVFEIICIDDASFSPLNELNQNHDVVIVNSEIRNPALTTVLKSKCINVTKDKVFNSTSFEQFFTLTASHSSFLGCIVIKRSIWNARNKAQLKVEVEKWGVTKEEKRDRERAREYVRGMRGVTKKGKAEERERMSHGKVYRGPRRDAVGRVIARFCCEIDCQSETSITGRYCPACDARLPSRARTPWHLMAKLDVDPWENESGYWKARAMEVIRARGTSEEEKRSKVAELGWFKVSEQKEVLREK